MQTPLSKTFHLVLSLVGFDEFVDQHVSALWPHLPQSEQLPSNGVLMGTLAVALLLATFTDRAFLCATAVSRPKTFLAKVLANVNYFGTCSFAVLTLRDGVTSITIGSDFSL